MDSRNVLFGDQLARPLSSDFEGSCARELRAGAERTLELVPGSAGDSSPPVLSDELLAAWRADARCVECGQLVATPHDAALLVVSRRITHATRCFLPALLRGHPALTRLRARARDSGQEVESGENGERSNA
jgi:hypothetical protein